MSGGKQESKLQVEPSKTRSLDKSFIRKVVYARYFSTAMEKSTTKPAVLSDWFMGGNEKSMEKCAGESLEHCEQCLMGSPEGDQETSMLTGMQTVKGSKGFGQK